MTYGNAAGDYNVKSLATALKRAELSAAFYFTLPGAKMIWQFGELGYDYSINTCSDGTTISEDCRVAEKPIKWDYFDVANRKNLYNAYAKLIKLKKENEVFNSADVDYSLANAQKYIIWRGAVNAFLVGNFGVAEASVNLTLPKAGTWYNALSGESLSVPAVSYSIKLQPGEYRLYTDNGGVAGVSDIVENDLQDIIISDIQILYNGGNVRSMQVYNLSGNMVGMSQHTSSVDISGLAAGAYIVKVQLADKVSVRKFIKR